LHRRDLLRLLGGVSVVAGLTPDELLALGRATHVGLERDRASLGFFDPHQMHTVAAAGERILPATDTPGAMAAECHRFAERIVANHYDATRQKRFLDGLIDLDRRAAASHGRLFIELDHTGQDGVLHAVETDAYAARAQGAESFWRDLKYLTLLGYYTSEIGIVQELRTNRFPGRFDGRAPIAAVSR
jgi:gluconate 2-dehydrogenase gamma chain